jgi:hypothetical protein
MVVVVVVGGGGLGTIFGNVGGELFILGGGGIGGAELEELFMYLVKIMLLIFVPYVVMNIFFLIHYNYI